MSSEIFSISIEEFDKIISILQNDPSALEIDESIDTLSQSKLTSSLQLILVTTLLNHLIPKVYMNLPRDIQSRVVSVLRSIVGLGNLLGRISILCKNNDQPLLKLYVEILQSVICPKLVSDHLLLLSDEGKLGTNLVEAREVDKLLFKGKCFAIVNEAQSLCEMNLRSPFISLENHIEYLTKELIYMSSKAGTDKSINKGINLYLNSLTSLDISGFIYETLFTKSNWEFFYRYLVDMRQSERKLQVAKLLTVYLPNRFYRRGNDKSKENNNLALSTILRSLQVERVIDDPIISRTVNLQNYSLLALIASLVAVDETILTRHINQLLRVFSDLNLSKTEPISIQISRTVLLVHMISYSKSVMQISKDKLFLEAISNRLGSFSNAVKSLAVALADKVCEFSNQPKIFNMENLDGFDDKLFATITAVKDTEDNITVNDAWELLQSPEVEEVEEVEIVSSKLDTISLKNVTIDSDDESDDDDVTVTPKKRLVKPLYVKDLLNYLSVDTKDELAFEKRRLALTTAPTLLRQKAHFGNEVEFYAHDLLKQLVALTNHYEEKDFDSLRLNAMIGLVVSNVESAPYLVELLATGDYSLQQRMCILSTLSLSARELKGFKDEIVSQSWEPKTFPTNKLPGNLHNKYLALDGIAQDLPASIIAPMEKSIQDDLMSGVSEDVKEFSQGKVLRISSRLTKSKKSNPTSQPIANFSKIIGPKFFSPLVNTWHAVGGDINIGHYSSIFIAHYIKTLTLILHCAYPSAVNLNDMIKEYFLILTPLVLKVSSDQIQLVESIVTGVLLVCDITDGQFLVSNYHENLLIFQQWLSSSWESIIDDKIKSLSAGLLLRLNSLMESFERTLLDQTNSLY
ncbi:hypothetical protein CAAN3_01S08702 [[Candida] anglica]